MPYSHAHCIISTEKFKIPLLIPPAGAPALTQSQISRLFCIFNIHLERVWNEDLYGTIRINKNRVVKYCHSSEGFDNHKYVEV